MSVSPEAVASSLVQPPLLYLGEPAASEPERIIAVDLADSAKYLAESLAAIERSRQLGGYVRAVRARIPGVAVNISPDRAASSAQERRRNLMQASKEMFARGAGYVALMNPDGTYTQDIQDELDLAFVAFKHKLTGPEKKGARKAFLATLSQWAP